MTEPERNKPIPSSEAVLEIKAVIEKVMLSPGEELQGVLVLAASRMPKGGLKNRVVAVPLDAAESLYDLMRQFLAGPSNLESYER